eukprot:648123-Rhodomonas_salina.7
MLNLNTTMRGQSETRGERRMRVRAGRGLGHCDRQPELEHRHPKIQAVSLSKCLCTRGMLFFVPRSIEIPIRGILHGLYCRQVVPPTPTQTACTTPKLSFISKCPTQKTIRVAVLKSKLHLKVDLEREPSSHPERVSE